MLLYNQLQGPMTFLVEMLWLAGHYKRTCPGQVKIYHRASKDQSYLTMWANDIVHILRLIKEDSCGQIDFVKWASGSRIHLPSWASGQTQFL